MNKYGVRIYPLDEQVILVKQTIKKPNSNTYIVDMTPSGMHKEAHVNPNDDQELANAVRAALLGKLKRSISDL